MWDSLTEEKRKTRISFIFCSAAENAGNHWNSILIFQREKVRAGEYAQPSCHFYLTVKCLRHYACSWGSLEEEQLWSESQKLSQSPSFIFTSLCLPASLFHSDCLHVTGNVCSWLLGSHSLSSFATKGRKGHILRTIVPKSQGSLSTNLVTKPEWCHVMTWSL